MKEKISPLMIVGAALFLAFVVWLCVAVLNMQSVSDKQKLESVRNSVENGITLCYSIEGAYPDNLEYLAECYGVVYDKDSYIVHYGYLASNIRPTVTVIERVGE